MAATQRFLPLKSAFDLLFCDVLKANVWVPSIFTLHCALVQLKQLVCKLHGRHEA